MPTLTIMITDRAQQMIDSLVESGRYLNASDVLSEGLRLIEQCERLGAEKARLMRSAVDEGVASAEAGQCIELDAEFEARIASLARRPGTTSPES